MGYYESLVLQEIADFLLVCVPRLRMFTEVHELRYFTGGVRKVQEWDRDLPQTQRGWLGRRESF